MELELGLALPNPICHNPIADSFAKLKTFDLNNLSTTDAKQTGFAISKHCFNGNKRDFDEAFENTIQTLPLLWKDEPDDNKSNYKKQSSTVIKKTKVVGWPPIKSSRMVRHGGGGWSDKSSGQDGSQYVKVSMEGVAIGRKVDLSLHISYHTLTVALQDMFGKYRKSMRCQMEGNQGCSYRLTYEDQDGDWMLVGDVPWETFIKSVKRLKIQRIGGS